MRKTPLAKVSKKRKKTLSEEAKARDEMLEKCEGHCFICGRFAPLEKNHTRDRKRFVLSCRECHSPDGVHKYLDEIRKEHGIEEV